MAEIISKDHAASGPEPDGLASLSKKDAQETAALHNQLQADAASGANVLELDEHATPEQKAAEAKRRMNEIKPPKEKEGGGMGMASDIGGKRVPATMTAADIDRVSKLEGQLGDGSGKAGAPTVQLPKDAIAGHTGMASHMLEGQPHLKPNEEETRAHPETQLISKYLSDQWYGRFYWDAAIMIFAVLTTYFATRFGGGIMAMFVIGGVCSTYYNASMRRTRQRARDDIARELAKKHMMTENETAGWINEFMRRFWLIYEPVLSATVIQTVDAILVQQCPSFLDSIRLTTFTLGTKAPLIDFVRTFPATEDDVVCMDWKISFTPNDTQDLTVRQVARKINPKVCLTIRLGKGVVGAGIPILVEDISFTAHARIKMKLISTFPHVQTVDLSLMSPPTFDFVLKPVGGNTFGFDIMSVVPGLEGFIKGQVDANVGPMMYNPNQFTINLEELLSGTPLDTACGVLQVTIWNARNLKAVKLGGGTPDPYIAVSIDAKDTLAKTKYKHSTSNPQYKSSHFILLNSLNGMLTFSVMDFNEHRSDSHIGQAAFDLAELEAEPEHENLSTPVVHEARERGSLQYSLSYYPVIKPEVGPDGKPEPLPETVSGVVRLTIHQVKGLDKPAGIIRDANPKARLLLNGKKIKETRVIKKTLDPIFEEHFEFLVTERRKAVIGIQVVDHASPAGYLSVKLDDLLAAKERQQDWFPLTRSKEGRVRMSAQWKPVLMSGSVNGGSGYVPSIGVLKFHMHRAKEVKNVEAAMGGKSDPYVTLKLRGQQVDGSVIVNNNLNPEWDEILYAPVHSLKEKVTIEVMDYQNSSKDRSLGTTEVNVAELANEGRGTREVPFTGTGKSRRKDKIHLGRGAYKGEIEYDVEFLGATALHGVEFEGAGNEAAKKAGDGEDEDGDDPDAKEGAEAEEDAALGEDAKAMTKATVSSGLKEDDAAATQTSLAHQASQKTHKKKESVATLSSVKTAATAQTDVSKKAVEGVEMSREQLLNSQSGILVFNLLGGQLARKNARLEVSFDDGYWPVYTTEASRTEKCTWDEVGEAVIKELDWSRMWLKLRTGSNDNDIFAEFQGNTKDVLERTLDKVGELTLASDAGGGTSTVSLTCKYIPCDVHLEPVESVNNTGFLRVDVVSAKNLRAADRGGKSDPYVKFNLNGKETFKSKIVKKTVNPEFNESLGECEVPSRVKAEALFEIFDWDQVGIDDKLGEARLDLSDLEPFQATEKVLPVTGKGAGEGGFLTVRLVFRPEFIATRGRKGTSLNLGRTFTAWRGQAWRGGCWRCGQGCGHHW
ncbi:Ca2-dependent lipid-binding protein CLB1/vesicle protein vp115/Granuphilin A, contains C2 domain [Ceraceosorus bombacis]|uniref:Ca2-dependent lipid-binding protein CLB1/vesicle protein vp115/Granuphilin A, contains C2 domain n=1 Tax=Ceraceosorus bombacis TaxID=401625 RepID=A0A0P1BP42_9BASI|nr:Ca2-dependent lipid-binding protein CLB1/vesicle protein vp115/Granuphilin A, contains C2 domain [Ceraceosorus bombacis]